MDSVLPITISPLSGSAPSSLRKERAGFFVHILDHFIPHARNNYHPHIFSHRLTALMSVMLISLKISTLALALWGPISPAFSSAISIPNIISLTNDSRTQQNLSELKENSLLDAAAQNKANDMLAKGYFSHNTPDGHTPWDFITAAGYNYITAGENLAVNFTEAENVEDAWMNSPGHRANILNKSYEEIGIGISQGNYQGHEAIFVVQMFGTLANQKIALDDRPTPVQTAPVPAPAKIVPAPASAPVVHAAEAKPQGSLNGADSKAGTSMPTDPVAAEMPVPEPLALQNPQLQVTGNSLAISAQASGAVVKVVASYGENAIMLEPKGNGTWLGSADISQLAQSNSSVVIKAYDMAGHAVTAQAGEFAGSTPVNFSGNPEVQSAHITLAGIQFDPHAAAQNFYLLFSLGMLCSLAIAIGVKRHVQHLSLVMNGSLVVMLAMFLWMR